MNETQLLMHKIKDAYYWIDYEAGFCLGKKTAIHILIAVIVFMIIGFYCWYRLSKKT